MKTWAIVSLVLVAYAVAGCGSGGFKPIERQDHFPKQEALQQIKQQAAPVGVFEKVDQIRVAEWRLTGPLPDIIGPVSRNPVDDLDRAAATVASSAENGVATEAMRCVARELGLFYLQYGALPEPELQRFVQHRCGATSTYISSTYRFWDQGDVSWEEANKDGRTVKALDEDMRKYLEFAPNPEIGAWYGSNDKRSVAFAVLGGRRVDIEPMPMTVGAKGEFEIKGTLLATDGTIVSGVVNQGRYGWKQCFPLKTNPPRFHVRCSAVPGDLEAGFEVYVRRRGELMSNSEFWQRVWPAGRPAQKYVLFGHAEPASSAEDAAAEESDADAQSGEPADSAPAETADSASEETDGSASDEAVAASESADDLEGSDDRAVEGGKFAEPLAPETFDSSPAAMRQEVVRLINEERARGNLSPVRLAEKQSDGAQQLAPHYWASRKQDDRLTGEQVMYGILAGWDVTGPIIDGNFYSTRAQGGPRTLVHSMRERPGARSVLFDPAFEQISLGLLYEKEPQVLGAVVHGWSFVPEESHTKRVNRLLDYITEFRDARGWPKLKKQGSALAYTKKLAEKLQAGELQLHEVANELLSRFAQENPGKRVVAHYIETHDVTQFEVPDAILDAVPLEVAVVVAPYQPPNSPWHTYGIAFAYIEPPNVPTKVASSESDDEDSVAVRLK